MKELNSVVSDECSHQMPTIIIVNNMVDYFEGLTHMFFITKSGDDNVMLIFGEADLQTMKSNLKVYLEEFKTLDINTLEVLTRFGMPLAHRKDVYRHMVSISEHLGIICPQILAASDVDLEPDSARKLTYYDDSDTPVGDIIYIVNRGRSRQLHSVAHELRHCWQAHQNNKGFYKNYKQHTGNNSLEFAKQKEEIDAEAYASLYVEKFLGVPDGTALMYDSVEAAEDWNDYTQEVKEHMKTIHI